MTIEYDDGDEAKWPPSGPVAPDISDKGVVLQAADTVYHAPIVRVEYPPNIEELEKVFGPLKGRPIFYSYGEFVYNPAGVMIPSYIMFHEWIHGQRQGNNVDGWWKNYLVDPQFRLTEEALAHRGEYDAFCRMHTDRNVRSRYLHKVAMKLSSPLYGKMVPYTAAKKIIEALR